MGVPVNKQFISLSELGPWMLKQRMKTLGSKVDDRVIIYAKGMASGMWPTPLFKRRFQEVQLDQPWWAPLDDWICIFGFLSFTHFLKQNENNYSTCLLQIEQSRYEYT